MRLRVFCCALVFICLAMQGCGVSQSENSKKTNCNLQDLVADVKYFPDHTQMDPILSPIPGAANQAMNPRSALIDFDYSSRGVHANQWINQWDDIAQAKAKFSRESYYLYINDKRLLSPWVTPPEVDFSKSQADEYKMACADVEGISKPKYICQMVARYDDYVIWFYADVNPHDMTLGHYKKIIFDIDNRVSQCLK